MAETDNLTAQKYLDITSSARFISMKWKDDALCLHMVANGQADPLDWFPESQAIHQNPSLKRAQDVCKVCPVRLECLCLGIYAGEKSGIWGGRPAKYVQRARRKLQQALR